jgi:hypothetical protein
VPRSVHPSFLIFPRRTSIYEARILASIALRTTVALFSDGSGLRIALTPNLGKMTVILLGLCHITNLGQKRAKRGPQVGSTLGWNCDLSSIRFNTHWGDTWDKGRNLWWNSGARILRCSEISSQISEDLLSKFGRWWFSRAKTVGLGLTEITRTNPKMKVRLSWHD